MILAECIFSHNPLSRRGPQSIFSHARHLCPPCPDMSRHVQTCPTCLDTTRITSRRRAYFRLPWQLSQLCAQNLHIFAYYPGMARAGVSSASGALSHTFFPTTFPHPTRYDASTALCGGVPVLVRCGFTVASFTGTFRKLIAERFAASGANLTPAPPRAPNASASCTLRGNSIDLCIVVVSCRDLQN